MLHISQPRAFSKQKEMNQAIDVVIQRAAGRIAGGGGGGPIPVPQQTIRQHRSLTRTHSLLSFAFCERSFLPNVANAGHCQKHSHTYTHIQNTTWSKRPMPDAYYETRECDRQSTSQPASNFLPFFRSKNAAFSMRESRQKQQQRGPTAGPFHFAYLTDHTVTEKQRAASGTATLLVSSRIRRGSLFLRHKHTVNHARETRRAQRTKQHQQIRKLFGFVGHFRVFLVER